MSELDTSTSTGTTAGTDAKPKRGLWILGLIVGLGIALGAAYFLGYLPGGSDTSDGKVSISPDDAVATVNQATITRAELDELISEQKTAFPEGAVDPTEDAAFEMAILGNLISIKLLLAEADAQGVQVTDDEVNAEISLIEQTIGGADKLDAEISNRGTTREELFENTKNELRMRRVIDANTSIKDIAVTDEEIQAMYDEAVAMSPEGQDVPPLTEVKEAARAQLIQQKSGEIVQKYLEELRAKAAVEILL